MDTAEGCVAQFFIERMNARLGIPCQKNPDGAMLVVSLPRGARGDLYWDAEGWRFEPDAMAAEDSDDLPSPLAEAQERARAFEYVALILGAANDLPVPRVNWRTPEGWRGTQGGRSPVKELQEFLDRTKDVDS